MKAKITLISLYLVVALGVNAATFIVTSNADAGAGTLRQAIDDANNTSGADVIEFAIGTGQQTITLTTVLPTIVEDLTIDGSTQPGFVADPLIEIDLTGVAGAGNGLDFSGLASSTVTALIINGSNDNGIRFLNCTGGQVDNCHIGTNVAGDAADQNDDDGILLDNSDNFTIQNSVLSGNGVNGIRMTNGSTGNTVKACKVGTNKAGTAAVANKNRGIFLENGDGNTVGGDVTADRNIISGNTRHGVAITSNGNTVKGNYIGTDVNGSADLGNLVDGIIMSNTDNNIIGTPTSGNVISGNNDRGIEVTSSGTSTGNIIQNNIIGLNATGTAAIPNSDEGIILFSAATGTTIGGENANEGNIISGNGDKGISSQAGNIIVKGNLIGTDITGTIDLGNSTHGILLNTGDNNTIGGPGGGRNIISGNNSRGIRIESGSVNNTIHNNFIGTDVNGTAAIPNGTGIEISACINNNIGGANAGEGNLISGNLTQGVINATSNGTVYLGNKIGTNATGTAALPNGSEGIRFTSSDNVTIGSTATNGRNLISGNGGDGIGFNSSSDNAAIRNNFIGTNAAGTSALPNNLGIRFNNSKNNTVGGTGTGEGNLISGNTGDGIFLESTATGNNFFGNKIGTNADGTSAIPNGDKGIEAVGSSGNLSIGSPTGTGGNLISGNAGTGISLTASNTATIRNNIVGLNAAGTAAIPNGLVGIFINTQVTGIQIGGEGANEGNVVSGNTSTGIQFAGESNTILGNKIGTNAAGTAAIGNGGNGISVQQGDGSVIGSTNAAGRNIISGNAVHGVLFDLGAFDNTLLGNYIGTDVTGTADLGNTFDGVAFGNAFDNQIGTSAAGGGNVISGNRIGVNISATATCCNVFHNNFIGTDASGTAALPNDLAGLQAVAEATIGGSGTGEGNLISGNTGDGVTIFATDVAVQGNKIGTNASGTSAIANGGNGIEIQTDGDDAQIGGSATGEGNLISGNLENGIEIADPTGVTILGNKIGTDVNGTSAIPNADDGITADGSDNLTVGGAASGAGNLISGNGDDGLDILGDNATILGNTIGLNASGTAALANGFSGITIEGDNATIGSTAAGNTISGNADDGISISDGTGISVKNNRIGTNAAGTAVISNANNGLTIEAQGVVNIGGSGANEGNVISGNAAHGILLIFADGTGGSSILGNKIGTDVSGAGDLGNTLTGILSFASASYTIGGLGGGANTIAFNDNSGVVVSEDQFFGSGFESTDILISENSITNNAVKGIEHTPGQTPVATPVLTTVASGSNPTVNGSLTGDPNTNYTLEFFKNTAPNGAGNHEGETFLGSSSVLTNGAGTVNFSINLSTAVNTGEFVTATARQANANTSEFSNGVSAQPLPVELVSLMARPSGQGILLNWITATELNNEGFFIEKLEAGKWWDIGFVNGHGTTLVEQRYSFFDENVEPGIDQFYRLRQMDFDGKTEYSIIVSAKVEGEGLAVGEFFPNPATDVSRLDFAGPGFGEMSITVFDVMGKVVYEKHETNLDGHSKLELDVSGWKAGNYLVLLTIDQMQHERKLVIVR